MTTVTSSSSPLRPSKSCLLLPKLVRNGSKSGLPIVSPILRWNDTCLNWPISQKPVEMPSTSRDAPPPQPSHTIIILCIYFMSDYLKNTRQEVSRWRCWINISSVLLRQDCVLFLYWLPFDSPINLELAFSSVLYINSSFFLGCLWTSKAVIWLLFLFGLIAPLRWLFSFDC